MSSNTSPAPWFSDTGRNAVYDKRVWFDESGARFGDTPNLVVRIEGGRPADVHLIAAAPELLAAAMKVNALSIQTDAHKKLRAAIAKATGRVVADDAAPECTCAAKDMTFGRCCKVTPNEQ